MPTLTPQSQAVVGAFGQQPGITSDHVRNLQPASQDSQMLIDQFNVAMLPGHRYLGRCRWHFSTAMIFSCLMLTACAHAQPENVSPISKEPTMTSNTTTTQGGDPVYPKLTAEQALLRILELIRTSKTIVDFTPERLEQVMGVPITLRGKGYGFAEQLTPQWSHGFDVKPMEGSPRFDFSFTVDPSPPPGTPDPPMTDICHIDFNRFTAELEAMGFSRGSYYDSPPQPPSEEFRLPHGRLMYDYFDRPGMRVEVYPRGESSENATHDCVEWVFIY